MGVNCSTRGRLPASEFDVVVVGGGMHGVSIARQCALGGQRTLLLEQHDFGSGATSRSSRVVGNVFPDLARGDFAVVRETLRERDRLLSERGHLVKPMAGVVAVGPTGRRSALEVRFGLWLRRKLAENPQMMRVGAEYSQLKTLTGSAGRSLFPFDDAICEFPERLVAEWLGEALSAGATAINYCRVLEVKVAGGQVRGVLARDLTSDGERFIPTRWVVNATGASVDHLMVQAEVRRVQSIAKVRSSYMVLRGLEGLPAATVYGEDRDGQLLVLTPWAGQWMFGPVHAGLPASASGNAAYGGEIERLQDAFERLLPGVPSELAFAFSGNFAVPAERGLDSRNPGNRRALIDHAEYGARGLLSVFGGALTAAHPVAVACGRKMGLSIPEPRDPAMVRGRTNGVHLALKQWAPMVSALAGIPESAARGLAAWHGRNALCVARMAQVDERLRASICPHSEHILAEAIAAVRYERAMTLSDILLRRVPVALSACWSEGCTRVAAQRIGRVLQWTGVQVREQVEEFEVERAALLLEPRMRPVRVRGFSEKRVA